MKRSVTYSFTPGDVSPLQSRFVDETVSLLVGFILPEEEDRDSPHPALKSVRRINGNAFGEDDVRGFVEYVALLASRAGSRIAELREERCRIAAGHPRSEQAYDFLIESIGNAKGDALGRAAEFHEAFIAAARLCESQHGSLSDQRQDGGRPERSP